MLKPITRRRFLKEGGTAALRVALCGTLRISAASAVDRVEAYLAATARP